MADVLLVLAMAAAVYLPKALPLFALSQDRLARLRPWLTYLAPAVLAALVAPSVAVAAEGPAPAWRLAPYAVALLAALVSRRMLPSVALGLAALAATVQWGG